MFYVDDIHFSNLVLYNNDHSVIRNCNGISATNMTLNNASLDIVLCVDLNFNSVTVEHTDKALRFGSCTDISMSEITVNNTNFGITVDLSSFVAQKPYISKRRAYGYIQYH